jgi:ATP-dependent helicase/nuclease subunit A
MTKKSPPDQKVRDRIASEFDKSFFVEAGAGSGKTHSLVDRMTGLIRYGHAGIENIAAVTFTRKAAVELRERFQIELEKIVHEKATPEEEKNRIGSALSNFEQSSISTIHSFCARLLRERPVEAGIDPGFKEIEEADDAIFAGIVWAEFLEKQGFENNKAIGWMQENGVSPQSIAEIYQKLVQYPDVEVFRELLERPDFTNTKKDIKEYVSDLKKKIPATEPAKGWDDLQKVVWRSLTLIKMGYLDDDRLFIDLLKVLNKKAAITQYKWPDKTKAKGYAEDFVNFQKAIVVPALRQWCEYLHKPLIEFALGGVAYYEKWRKERSLLNFQDLLMRTADLLRKNEEVRTYFKSRIKYLLVDEFQDTDPIQAEITMLLTGTTNDENDWRKIKPNAGALFLVGDPKQSIYRFRRADIDIYNQVKGIFNNGAGEVIELTSNFRSLDPIGDLANSVFSDLFPEKDTKHQAKFAPLNTVREKSDEYMNGVFINAIGKISGNPAYSIAAVDATIVANWICQSINGGLKLERSDRKSAETSAAKPGDFMIIAKGKARLAVYAKALESLGVPYEISGGENFSNSEELYEIYKILKAAADPKDPISIVAALRGLFIGASDSDLYEFVKEGGRFSYFVEHDKGPEIIKAAFKRLSKYNNITARYSPVTAIEMIVEDLGTIPLAMSEEMGSSKAGNILKAIELLRGEKPNSTCSFIELVEYLRDIREMSKIEEMSLYPGTAKAVRIMNLHKAKGLEAPIVILADPGPRKDEFPQECHIARTDSKSVGYFAITRPVGDYGSEFFALPGNWEKYEAEENLYNVAEKDRLDYVAVTRAKNILVVSTYCDGDRSKPWESLYPYLAKMPPLPLPKACTPTIKKDFKFTKTEWKAEMGKITSCIEIMTTESYHVSSVTDMVEKSDVFDGESKGHGADWGSVVHRALELCGKGQRGELEAMGPRLLEEYGVPITDLSRLIKVVDITMKHEIWLRMEKSMEKYFEVPFSGKEKDIIVRGVIDMIFKEPEGWVIVDYKTDDFEKEPKRKEAYENQLKIYSNFWEEIVGGRVKEKMLLKVR